MERAPVLNIQNRKGLAGLEAVLVMIFVFIGGSNFLKDHVHSMMTVPAGLLMVAVIFYLMHSSSVNRGAVGYVRMIWMIRYMLYRLQKWWCCR